jgi:anti-anti-sigma regulatory factor
MLRIEKLQDGTATALYISGRIQAEDLPALELHAKLGAEGLILDLGEVQLVDEAAVQFLAGLEMRGVFLRRCPAYISEWIRRENEPS